MRIMMVYTVSGTCDGYVLPPRGNEIDLPDHVAADLCASKVAIPVVGVPSTDSAVETAVADEVDVEQRAEPEPATEDDLDSLRAQAETAGVKVDKRWGADRLREEISKANKS